MKSANWKKYLAAVMAGMMVLGLGACNAKETEETKAETKETVSQSVDDQTKDITVLDDFDPTEFVTEITYKGIEVEVEDDTLLDEELETSIQSLLSSYAVKEEITDRVTAEGDVISMDYSGALDGVAFEGGTATNQTINVGNSGFIPDLDEALVGAKVGEEFVVDVKFPEDYWNADLAGAVTQFTVLIHYIEGAEILPELTDEFVKGLEDYESNTVDEFREEFRTALQAKKSDYYKYVGASDVWEQIVDTAVISGYPDNYVDAYYEDMVYYYESMASTYGMEMEELVSYYDYTLDEFLTELRTDAEEQVKSEVLYRYIAQQEGIEVSEAEYLEVVQEYMAYYGYTDMAEFVNAMGADTVEKQCYADALQEKVINFCFENANRTLVTPEQ